MEPTQKIYEATLYLKSNYKRMHIQDIKNELRQLGLDDAQLAFMLKKYHELKNNYDNARQLGNKHVRYLIFGVILLSIGFCIFFGSILFDIHSRYVLFSFVFCITAGIVLLQKGAVVLRM